MDSRLIAGAYSQHYRALEQENNLVNTDQIDSIARAKKLSLETNKRRKTQAQKRKIEAQREEKRRNEILTKRREEQKLATEKYQRSHIPPSARQNSGRRSPRRLIGGTALEDALCLIRGSPRRPRPGSARDRIMSPRKENEDPFERPYFDKPGHHMARPGSGKTSHQIGRTARAELMDHSLQNLTSSKTLFEQQLEQQQTLLLEQQQQSMREFNKAVRQEIDSDLTNYNGFDDEENKNYSNLDGSCSSLDSLEESREGEQSKTGNWSGEIKQARASENKIDAENSHRQHPLNHPQYGDASSNQARGQFYLHKEERNGYSPLNQDMTQSASYQLPSSLTHEASQRNAQQLDGASLGGNSNVGNQVNKGRTSESNSAQVSGQGQHQATPLKQFSTDSLESGSSSVSLLSTNGQNIPSQAQAVSFTSLPSQTAWTSPSPSKTDTAYVAPATSNASNNNGSASDVYNPRYASAISLSIWPGQPGPAAQVPVSAVSAATSQPPINSTRPHSSRPNLTSATPTSTYPSMGLMPKTVSIASAYSPVVAKNDLVLKSGVVGSSLISPDQTAQILGGNASDFNLNWQGLQYSLMQENKNLGGPQNFSPVPNYQQHPTSSTGQNLGQFSQMSCSSAAPNSMSAYSSSAAVVSMSPQVNSQGLNILQPQHLQQSPEQVYQYQQQQHQKQQQQQQNSLYTQQYHLDQQTQQQKHIQMSTHQNASLPPSHTPQTSGAVSSGAPVPAVRTIFPAQRPPIPKSETEVRNTLITGKPPPALTQQTYSRQTSSSAQTQINQVKPSSEQEEEGECEEEKVVDEAPPIKGILKSGPVSISHQVPGKAPGPPRDSLELARLQAEKKTKKKSVRFADSNSVEPLVEVNEPPSARNIMVTNSGTPQYRPSLTRPASARVVSTTQRTDISSDRAGRASSAGTSRQAANTAPQASQAKSVQIRTGTEADQQHESGGYRANLPPSPQQFKTSEPAINRPQAAAHIIRSNSDHHLEKAGVSGAASTAHKSQLESKVKNIYSSGLMGSRGPVKVPTSAVTVYNVACAGLEENEDCRDQDNGHAGGLAENGSGNNNKSFGYEQRQRLRDPSPASKRVPISNSVVTRTSIVPASTKISIPQSNTGIPSYSSTTTGGGNSAGNSAVYDENGMRIDRTPTDEEITWLWDKVRNCLNKDDTTGAARGQTGGGVDQSRPPPTLSTKLIDGASLGFGVSTSPGVNGLRTGAGFFQPHTNPPAQGNKVRPALQQQGSYLRRYGLLKQRRATSATGGAPTQQTVPVQRASSAVHVRHPPSVASPGTQQTSEHDGPPMISQAYVAQDGVSESTAAFLMAERLAKQSLSDSHIQSGMNDAQIKQEAHNIRSRLAVNRGHSALSIEEQNLLASLDKLNERLRVADTHYTGTVHYHQPYQAHLPGFRRNQTPVVDSRGRMLFSPRSQGHIQQRSQSARIRQQTRQYR